VTSDRRTLHGPARQGPRATQAGYAGPARARRRRLGGHRRPGQRDALPGATLLIATPTSSPTSRNLQATGRARVGVGPTRDVVLIEGTAQALAADDLPGDVGDAFAAKTGFDPRELATPYTYFRIRPRRLQAWREANELQGRELLRDGRWVVP
jgi:hypothetical protein